MSSKKLIALTLILAQLTLGCASRTRYTPIAQVDEVKRNRDVTLELRDDTFVEGEYKGAEEYGSEAYATLYEAARYDINGVPLLPRLGPVEIRFDEDKTVTGSLEGFRPLNLDVLQRDSQSSSPLGYERIEQITDADGNEFEGRLIQEMATHGNIPFRARLEIETPAGKQLVGSHEVRAVHWTDGGGNAGTWLGIAVVGLIIALIAATEGDPPPTTTPSYSCPYVYAWNGNGWVLDAEVFGGSFVAAAQRTDTASLRYADTSDGHLRLRLTNELNETQYVDRIRAFAVDHPRGTTVVAAEDGSPVVLRAARAARRATTLAGENVTSLVARADELTWGGQPDGSSLVGRDGRDGLILEFERPAGATTMALALRLRNTSWGAWLQGHLNTLHGAAPETWYTRLETSPDLREAWHRAALREAMLRVQIETPEGWQTVDHVWEVGPAVLRDRALRIELGAVRSRTVRLRLDATARLWAIDSIVASFDPGPPPSITELALAEARDAERTDLTSLLTHADGDRHVMLPYQGAAELRFVLPSLPAPEMERTLLLDATGYYRIHTRGRGAPRTELLSRLLHEPGAFARYSRDLWQRATLAVLTDPRTAASW